MKKLLLFTLLLPFLSPVFLLASSADAASRCPRGVVRDGHLAYKICVWANVGPALNLIWCDDRTDCQSESRGSVRKGLYQYGTLNSGSLPIEVGLRGLKPNTAVLLLVTTRSGTIREVPSVSDSDGAINVIVSTVNSGTLWGGTLWVPERALTGKHFVKLRSVGKKKLLYNEPRERWFTRKDEVVREDGTLKFWATRLNTKVAH